MRLPSILLLLSLTCGFCLAEEAPTIPAVRFDPVQREMEGWTVHCDPAILEGGEHAVEGAKALRMLGDHLHRISLLVEESRLVKLRKCEIWIEHEHPVMKAMQ